MCGEIQILNDIKTSKEEENCVRVSKRVTLFSDMIAAEILWTRRKHSAL